MQNELVVFAITVFTGFFAVMNPIANLPAFIALVQGADKKTAKSIAKKGALTAFLIITSFVFLGKEIFELFNLTIPAFKMTGGILLFSVGLDMLNSKKPALHDQSSIPIDQGVGISPLAIPLMAGPGTIITAVNYVQGVNYLHVAIVVGMFGLMAFLNYLSFSSSDFIVRKVGENLIAVIGKIMGLILAIMGMGMLVDGIKVAFNLAS